MARRTARAREKEKSNILCVCVASRSGNRAGTRHYQIWPAREHWLISGRICRVWRFFGKIRFDYFFLLLLYEEDETKHFSLGKELLDMRGCAI